MKIKAACDGFAGRMFGPASVRPDKLTAPSQEGKEPPLPLKQHLPPLTAPAPQSAPILHPKPSCSDREQLFVLLFNELIRHVLRRFLPS